jgi:hypothetical protein
MFIRQTFILSFVHTSFHALSSSMASTSQNSSSHLHAKTLDMGNFILAFTLQPSKMLWIGRSSGSAPSPNHSYPTMTRTIKMTSALPEVTARVVREVRGVITEVVAMVVNRNRWVPAGTDIVCVV